MRSHRRHSNRLPTPYIELLRQPTAKPFGKHLKALVINEQPDYLGPHPKHTKPVLKLRISVVIQQASTSQLLMNFSGISILIAERRLAGAIA